MLPSRALLEGRLAIATNSLARDAVDAVVPQGVRRIAYGQAVWSCPANAGDKLQRSAQRRWQKSWFAGEITEQP